MKIKKAEFVKSAVSKEQYPRDGLPQIAFAGRSNVGKSSCINTLLERRSIARVSQTPGKTRTINFFLVNEDFYFVDLPGYGYARTSKEERLAWGRIMQAYFEKNPALKHLFLLLDIRHEPKEEDLMMYEYALYYRIPVTVIATKSDKISRGAYQKSYSLMRKKLKERQLRIFPLSSLKKTGRDEIRGFIEEEILLSFKEAGEDEL